MFCPRRSLHSSAHNPVAPFSCVARGACPLHSGRHHDDMCIHPPPKPKFRPRLPEAEQRSLTERRICRKLQLSGTKPISRDFSGKIGTVGDYGVVQQHQTFLNTWGLLMEPNQKNISKNIQKSRKAKENEEHKNIKEMWLKCIDSFFFSLRFG